MAQRNQGYWNEDYRRGQDARDWEDERQGGTEWRAGRGGYEDRNYEGRGYEGRFGREDFGRGYEGRGYEGRGYEGRGYEGRGYEDRNYEGRGLGGPDYAPTGRGRMSTHGSAGYAGGRGYGENFGGGGGFVRGYQGRLGDLNERSGYGGDVSGGPGGMDGFGRYGEDRSGHGLGTGRMQHGLGRMGEDERRGSGSFLGGGWGGMEPDMGRDYRPEDYGRGEGSLRGIGYGMARRGQGERRQGRGPKGYARSDERIREDVCDRLMQGWMNAENVDVQVKGGEVTLLGTVDSRHEKRAIEDLAEEVLGVKEVHNQLRVSRAGAQTQGTQAVTGPQTQGGTDTGRAAETGRAGTPPTATSDLHS